MKLFPPWAKPKDNYFVLLAFIVLSQAAGLVGTIFTIPSIPAWYAGLNKPLFSPPNYLFGPVWTLLYLLIGISAYLVWRRYRFGKKAKAFWQAFLTQLVLNAVWSPAFFGLRSPGLGLLIILPMWYYILLTIRAGSRLVPWSAYLLYPYLAWVSFATLLNAAIAYLN